MAPIEGVAASSTFEDFYASELEWARRLAYVLTGDGTATDDIVQEAFARLYKHYERLDAPRAYLRVTIVNLFRTHVRRARRDPVLRAAPDANPVHDRAVIEMLDMIDRLPPRQRAVLVLRYFEDMSEAEIADALGCQPGTVKSLSARALARLREELDQ